MKRRVLLIIGLITALTAITAGWCLFGKEAVVRSYAAEEDNALKLIETFPKNGAKDVFSSSGIEFRFDSEKLSAETLRSYVSIKPEIDFYVTEGADPDTLVLYPYDTYVPETLYTVTLKAGFSDTEGRKLQEDVQLSFCTAAEALEKYYSGLILSGAGNGTVVNALTDEIPAFFLLTDQEIMKDLMSDTPEAEVRLYRFEDKEGFAKALTKKIAASTSAGTAKETDPSEGEAVTEAGRFTLRAELMDEEYWWWGFKEYAMSFPEPLPEGQYLAKFDFNVKTQHKDYLITKYLLLQSTGFSAYCMNSDKETIAWVHDSVTGKVASDADVRIYGAADKVSGKTDENGIAYLDGASFKTARDENAKTLISDTTVAALNSYYHILEVEKDGKVFIDAISENRLFTNNRMYYGNDVNAQYYTYLYVDRPVYQPSDEICFYGIVKPRYEGIELPETMTVSLPDSFWSGNEITSIEVSPDEHGMFEGRLAFENQETTYTMLAVLDAEGNELMKSNAFRIEAFEKPVYTSEIYMDKPVYVLGKDRDDSAKVNIDISYFDGTPATEYSMTEEWHQEGLSPAETTLKADEKGHMETVFSFDPRAFENSWRPQSTYISYRSAEAENEILYVSAEPMVIPRDVILEAKNDKTSNTLTVTTHAVDVSGITDRKDLFDTDNFRGEGLSRTVEGELMKCWYERIAEGTKYDYIYKRSYEAYRYEFHEDHVGHYTIETTDGTGEFVYELPESDVPTSYYMDLQTEDSAGRHVTMRTYLSYSVSEGYRFYDEDTYEFRLLNNDAVIRKAEKNGDYFFGFNENLFTEDSPAKFELTLNGEPFEMPEGGAMLSAAVGHGFQQIEAKAEGGCSIDFSEELLPNYIVVGAYFDGKNTWPIRRTSMNFDTASRALDIEIAGDQESYLPGDVVTVALTLKNKADGIPVSEGTPVVLSVVDEAIFAIEDQMTDVLNELYRNLWIPFSDYTSKNNLNVKDMDGILKTADMAVEEVTMEADDAAPTMAAEGGMKNGVEEHIRSEFKDTAFFETAYTDASGRAEFTFRIPDNMTSWRFSAVAVTDDAFAGSKTKDFICSKPYYTVPVLNDVMLEGDTFGIGLRSAGTIENTACCYTVSVLNAESGEEVMTAKTESESFRDYAAVGLDGLTEGSYIVRITGMAGEYTDTSEYPFEVMRSGLEAYASVTMPLSEFDGVNALRYPVDVMIYDKNAAVYHQVLSDILGSAGIRADERIASYYAMSVLAEDGSSYWGERLKEADLSDLSYIFPNYPYAKDNAEVSALAYLAAKDILPTRAPYGILPQDIDQGLDSPYAGSPYAAYILEALDEEGFMEDPAALLETEELSFRDRIYLMTAIWLSGDTETAGSYYDAEVQPFITTAEAVSGEIVASVNIDADTTEHDDTAAALIMASLLKKEEAEQFAAFLIYRDSDKDIYPLEELIYLVYGGSDASKACEVRYMFDGEVRTESLRAFDKLHLSLQKEALDAFDPTAVSGDPYITAFYICDIEELTDESTKKLSVSIAADKETYQVNDVAAITITPDLGDLDPSFGSSTMLLDVYIPSGMRFARYTPDTNDWNHWYLSKREGQHLRFVLYDGSDDRSGDFPPLTFYASCVTPGSYIVEKAYLSSLRYDTWGISERSMITIE